MGSSASSLDGPATEQPGAHIVAVIRSSEPFCWITARKPAESVDLVSLHGCTSACAPAWLVPACHCIPPLALLATAGGISPCQRSRPLPPSP